MNIAHAYAIEILVNPGMTGEHWSIETENGTWPTFDGANDERTAYIESGYVAEQVRVVALIHTEESLGEEEEVEDPNLHRRFSYGLDKGPHEECPASTLTGVLKHECDLPKVHVTRHQCGMCGMMF